MGPPKVLLDGAYRAYVSRRNARKREYGAILRTLDVPTYAEAKPSKGSLGAVDRPWAG
jgi:hypothetical protein